MRAPDYQTIPDPVTRALLYLVQDCSWVVNHRMIGLKMPDIDTLAEAHTRLLELGFYWDEKQDQFWHPNLPPRIDKTKV